jgi:hypothetical protein
MAAFINCRLTLLEQTFGDCHKLRFERFHARHSRCQTDAHPIKAIVLTTFIERATLVDASFEE